MRIRSRVLRYAVVVVVWVVAAGIAMVQPAGAATTRDDGGHFMISVAADGKVTVTEASPKSRDINRAHSQTFSLPGKTRAGVNSNIVCYVYDYGPGTPDGHVVVFAIAIECDGGVPLLLAADLDIYDLRWGEFQPSPGAQAHANCRDSFTPSLPPCVAQTSCFQTGNYYYGQAYLTADDENGVFHEAWFYYGPYWVPCVV
jgi:hypothetical protein